VTSNTHQVAVCGHFFSLPIPRNRKKGFYMQLTFISVLANKISADRDSFDWSVEFIPLN
jgi:hypothetical protein